jgi:hypothetical protein
VPNGVGFSVPAWVAAVTASWISLSLFPWARSFALKSRRGPLTEL